jgi:anti-sigma B factor antagonist
VSDNGQLPDPISGTGGAARHGADWIIATLPAEVDIANVGQVLADLLAAIDRGCPVIIADMSRTTFCDRAGVGALLAAASQAARAGAELRIVARARPVLRTFELTGLQLTLKIYPTCADAQRGPPEITVVPDDRMPAPIPAPVVRLRRPQPADVR